MRHHETVISQKISREDNIYKKFIEYGILGLIIFSPLPAASVNEWSILVIQILVLVMIAAYFVMNKKFHSNKLLSHSLKWPQYMFIGLFTFIFVQALPLPVFLIRILSPNIYTYHRTYAYDFSKVKFLSLSLIPAYTLQKGLELLAYFLIGFLIFKVITHKHQIIRIYYVLIAIGAFEALYGMFELYSRNPRILFYKKIHGLDSVSGTFVNRDHFSGYLEMIIPLAIGLVIARIDLFSLPGLKWREKVLRLSEKSLSINLLVTFSIIIMSVAIIFSKSRSGVFILILTFILLFELIIIFYKRVEDKKKGTKIFLTVIFLLVIFVSLYMGIESTLERFSLNKLLREQRPVFWANTLKLFVRFPFFGTGLGTFSSLYPDWESSTGQIVRLYHAHNDYLEYLSELGIIGMTLLLGGVLFMLIKSFEIWRERRHSEIKGLALGGIVSVLCILIHSITDFNLHIPANMLLFSVVLSLTMVTVFYKKGRKA